MSHPHLEAPDIWSLSQPCSPNASVDKSKYIVKMVTSKDVVRALWEEGTGSYISKADW